MANRLSFRSWGPAAVWGLVFGMAIWALLGALAWPFEARSEDWRSTFREPPPRSENPGIVLVAISDATYEGLAEPRVFWGGHFALALERLSAMGAVAIGLDLIPAVPVDRYAPELDEAFATALMNTPGVVSIYQRVRLPDGTDRTLHAHDQLVTALLLGGGLLGHNHIVPDPDQIVRRWNLASRLGETVDLSFPLALVEQASGEKVSLDEDGGIHVGEDPLESTRAGGIRVHFRGPPNTYPRISFEDLVAEELALDERVRELLRGSIVIIGSTSLADQDVHSAPTCDRSQAEWMPGIELHANVIDTILADDGLLAPERITMVLFAVLAIVMAAVCFALLSFPVGLVLLALAIALWSFAVVGALEARMLLPWVAPVVALTATFSGVWISRSWKSARQKAEIRGLFERYVPKSVVKTLIDNPELAKLDGERRIITVLFSDIRNFTTLSEGMDAEELSRLLNRYLTLMTRTLLRHGATVDKYIGDGIMAIWGAPLEAPEGPKQALRCAIEMMDGLGSLREQWLQEGVAAAANFDIGVGIHTGVAFVGNVGSPERLEYTAVGDTVNLAARLESTNKELGTNILISEATYSELGGLVTTGRVEELSVKGRKKTVVAYEVTKLREIEQNEEAS